MVDQNAPPNDAMGETVARVTELAQDNAWPCDCGCVSDDEEARIKADLRALLTALERVTQERDLFGARVEALQSNDDALTTAYHATLAKLATAETERDAATDTIDLMQTEAPRAANAIRDEATASLRASLAERVRALQNPWADTCVDDARMTYEDARDDVLDLLEESE